MCSSITPVFNFLTWKAFPLKETEKQSFSVTRGLILILYVNEFSLHLTTILPIRPPPKRCVICGSCGSLFYMRWLLCPAFTLLWPVREQLTNSTVYFCCCWLSHAVSPFAGLFHFNISLLLSRCFSLGLLLQFNCVRAAVISRSPRTEQFMVNTLQKARYLANPMFCSCSNSVSHRSRHLVSTVTDLHSILL